MLLLELDAARRRRPPYLHDVGDLTRAPGVPTATLAGDPLYRTVYQAWLDRSAGSESRAGVRGLPDDVLRRRVPWPATA